MSDEQNRTRAEQRKAELYRSIGDERFSWRYVRHRARRDPRLAIVILLLFFAAAFVVYVLRFLSSLDYACTYDNRDQATCFFFYRQSLPPGCPPDCGGTDLNEVNLSGADLSRTDFSETILSRAELRGASLQGAWYNLGTRWPAEFDPLEKGAVFQY